MPERPLPLAVDTLKVTLVWRDATIPREASNNLYFRDVPGTQDEDDLAVDLYDNFTAAMWTTVFDGGEVEALEIVRLNGTSATKLYALATAAKVRGAGGTDPILQGAHVITFRSDERGPANRSRIFLPWIAELQQVAGVLNAANVATMQAAWVAFGAAMLVDGWEQVVVPYQLPPTVSTPFQVTGYTARPYLNTQRRRARR